MLRLRKLVADDWVHVSPELLFERWEVGVDFFARFKCEKIWWPWDKPFEALIPLDNEHQGLLKLYVTWSGGEVGVSRLWGETGLSPKEWIFFETKNQHVRGILGIYWNLVRLLEVVWRVLIKKKQGGNKKKRFYSKMRRNALRQGLATILWDSPCVTYVSHGKCLYQSVDLSGEVRLAGIEAYSC